MRKNKLITGLDIGSGNIRVAVAQFDDSDNLKVVGTSVVPSAGIRKGAVIDIEEATQTINFVLEKLEKKIDTVIEDIIISVGGMEINIKESKGVIAIGKANGEVEPNDIQRVLEASQMVSLPPNTEVVQVVPKNYKLDDQGDIKNPLGMQGIRLEANILIIEDSAAHFKNLIKSVEQTDVNVVSTISNSLACAEVVLNKKQKELGVAMINIGQDTTSLAIFEENELVYLSTLPIGGGHITNDIAIGLRVPIDVAEKIKIEYGSASTVNINKRENIELADVNSEEDGNVSRYHTAEIIEARLEEIFEMVNKELKSIKKNELLPAGVVLTGGGAELIDIEEFAKKILKLPVKIGYPSGVDGVLDEIDSPSFSTVVGLLVYSQKDSIDGRKDNKNIFSKMKFGNIGDSKTFNKGKELLKKFLP